MGTDTRQKLLDRLSPKDLALWCLLAELHFMGADGHPKTARALDAWLIATAEEGEKA